MKVLKRWSALLLMVLVLTACASGPRTFSGEMDGRPTTVTFQSNQGKVTTMEIVTEQDLTKIPDFTDAMKDMAMEAAKQAFEAFNKTEGVDAKVELNENVIKSTMTMDFSKAKKEELIKAGVFKDEAEYNEKISVDNLVKELEAEGLKEKK